MNDSNKGDAPVPPRNTLKLKAPRVKPSLKPEVPALPPRSEPVNWADDHKRRMQADMDALGSGDPAPSSRQRR